MHEKIEGIIAKEILYGQAIDSSFDAIIVFNINGNIILANKAAFELFGYQKKVFINDNINLICKDKTSEIITKTIQNGYFTEDIKTKNMNGKNTVIHFKTSLIKKDDKLPLAVVGIGRDITQKIEAQKMFKAYTRELTHLNKLLINSQHKTIQSAKKIALGRFITHLAHEINNPLSIISGNAQYLIEQTDWKAKPSFNLKGLNEAAKIIFNESSRSSRIISNLMIYERKEAISLNLININFVLESLIKSMKRQFEINNIKVKKKYYKGLPKIKGNRDYLKQAFMNIFVNSIQAIKKRGVITVTTSKDNRNVKVSIKDTGIGISNENLKKIFDPFYTTKAVGKGPGLGLSIVQSIIQKHNGHINVTSKRGTNFTIVFPIST